MTEPVLVLDDVGVRRVALAPVRLCGGREHEFRGAWQLSSDGWLVVERAVCPACYEPFRAGEHVTLAPLGPGDDPELRERAAAGRWYPGTGVICHFACRFGVESDDLAQNPEAEQ